MDYSLRIDVFSFQARVAAGGLKVAACQHGASGAARAFTGPALQRACFSTSVYKQLESETLQLDSDKMARA